jgi:hypothetical protein
MGGRDRGKFNKRGGRGGGSRFQATSAEEIEQRNNRIADFDEKRASRRAEADSDDEDNGANEQVNRAAKGVSDLNVGENPNRAAEEKPMTRKQREQADKERKAAEYRRRHELGLTDEYKRDMAKLAEVKRRREEAEAKAAAAKELAELEESNRKAKVEAANLEDSDSDSDGDEKKKKKKKSKKKSDVPKLDKIVIKKMKPAQLKEALKERGCDIQGNAKTLTKRLLDFEASR